MTKLEEPVKMTVCEANRHFFPNSYLMINCELDLGASVAGEVVAYAPLKQKGPLVDYAWLLQDEGGFGEVRVKNTKDPLDGGSLLVEYYTPKPD